MTPVFRLWLFIPIRNWTLTARKQRSGFIYVDRYKDIATKFQKIPLSGRSAGSTTFSKDSIQVVMNERKFDKTKHKLTYAKESQQLIQLIDDRRYWGTDGDMPKKEYAEIVVRIGSQKTSLPASGIKDLFEPSLGNAVVNYDHESKTLYIQSANSDGAGSYSVIWKIVNGVYKDRYIAYGF